MEAKPLRAPVERDQEQALRFRRGEQSLRFAAACCRSRQGRADAFELRHLMKQPANARVQAIEHDFPQVFDDVAIGPREIVDDRLRVCLSVHRERGQLQRRRPAFGLLGQLRAALGAECVGQPGFAKALDLAGVEREFPLSQLQEPATKTQLAESQPRRLATAQHELDGRRRVVHEPFDDTVGLVRGDQVQVVEKQHEPAVVLRKIDRKRFQRRGGKDEALAAELRQRIVA